MKPRKRLYNEYEHYNPLGEKWSKKVNSVLEPLVEEAARQGISMLDLAVLISRSADFVCIMTNALLIANRPIKRKK